jgi:HrpA-like RNA helicase
MRENKNIKIQCNDIFFYFENNFEILFITENQLLNILNQDPILNNCDILLIDEVHERKMKLDLILFYMKYLTLNKNNFKKGFKLILVKVSFNINYINDYFNEFIEDNNIGLVTSIYIF